ncbi:hypothetical protein EsH8_V_000962 [Colletotrichum jinshuiense]
MALRATRRKQTEAAADGSFTNSASTWLGKKDTGDGASDWNLFLHTHDCGRARRGSAEPWASFGFQRSWNFKHGRRKLQHVQGRDDQDNQFLADLRTTDPRDDKARTERIKGGLLRDSYHWILDHADFRRWRDNDDDDQSRLLWIKGDPGKGKTMLLCGIVDELQKLPPGTGTLSYFFCQATDVRLNNATAVLRGLIYLLLVQRPALTASLRGKYDHAGKRLFEDVNSWDALSNMLIGVLQGPGVQTTYLAIDALDECDANLDQLLDLIVKLSALPRVKLVVSSRNWLEIEDALAAATKKTRLCLELNHTLISAAVGKYIQYKVNQLALSKGYDPKTKDAVQRHLATNANDTFLWVALVCQQLADPQVRKWHTRAKLYKFPAGLDSLYKRMVDHMFNSDDASLCREVLGLVSVVYRPLTLKELASLVESLEEFHDVDALEEVIGLCGCLLTIREGVVYFVHQSAKDFLLRNESTRIHPHGLAEENRNIFTRSLQIMSKTLRRDIYNLRVPGYPIDRVKAPEPDPLAPVRYSCVYWINHLADGLAGQELHGQVLSDDGPAYAFLANHYLHWLEALSLLDSVSGGILQMYTLTRLTQTLEGHRNRVTSVAFSDDGTQLASASYDKTVRIWDTATGQCLQTFQGHKNAVISVVFLGNDKEQLASASWDKTVKIWDTTTGRCLRTIHNHSDAVCAAFSGDGTQVALASHDKVVRIWDTTTGKYLQKLQCHRDTINTVAFSSENKLQMVSASGDKTIKIWNTATGQCLQTLQGHSDAVTSVTFSGSNRMQLASASEDTTVKIWDATTGQCLQTLQGHSGAVTSVTFSSNNRTQLASASEDNTVKIWDISTGQCLQTLQGHSDAVASVAFSGNDRMQLASASYDNTVKIWDNTTSHSIQTLQSHSDGVYSVAFSGDRMRLASASHDKTAKIWDTTTGQCLQTLQGHSEPVISVAFSGDSMQVASASHDGTVKIWDTTTGQCLQTLQGHKNTVIAVAFSGNNSEQLASASWDKTVKIWEPTTGQCVKTFQGHMGPVVSVAFSGDGTQLVSASHDKTIKIWDTTTSQCLRTLWGHGDAVISIALSGNSAQLASASYDKTIKIWDISTGQCLRTLNIGRALQSISFSATGQELYTNAGVLDVQTTSTMSAAATPQSTDSTETLHFHGYAFSADNAWITRDSKNLLWLPPEYRPRIKTTTGATLVIGCTSGKVLILRFSESELCF